MAITHTKVATLPDQPGVEINKNEWNDSHVIAAGTITEAMQVLADNTTGNVATTQHGYAPKAPNNANKFLNGVGAWSVPSGGASLNGITAATGAVTIASGNNTGIVWNWANTTNTTVAFTLGETSAATNGTSTSGVPNQVLFKLSTLASSTQSPLSVYSRATHVFSVSPTVPQILANSGTSSNPTYSFAASTGSGFYYSNSIVAQDGGFMAFSTWNTASKGMLLGANRALDFAVPHIADQSSIATGITFDTNNFGIAIAGAERARWTATTMIYAATAFASLGTPTNGAMTYCSDCDPGTLFNSTCASAGTKTGAFARRVNGVWLCD